MDDAAVMRQIVQPYLGKPQYGTPAYRRMYVPGSNFAIHVIQITKNENSFYIPIYYYMDKNEFKIPGRVVDWGKCAESYVVASERIVQELYTRLEQIPSDIRRLERLTRKALTKIIN